MKSLILTIPLLFLSFSVFAQEENKVPNYSVHCYPIEEMAVFPGCESIDKYNTSELQTCMQKSINELLTIHLEEFIDKMDELEISEAESKIFFTVSKEGEIINISGERDGNSELTKACITAMNLISETFLAIKPVKLSNGEITNYTFALPIKISLDNSKNQNGKDFENIL